MNANDSFKITDTRKPYLEINIWLFPVEPDTH